MFTQHLRLPFICLFALSLCLVLVSWKSPKFKQDNCKAQLLFSTTTASFKQYSKDDYCVIVDISGSIDKHSPPTTFQWLTGDGGFAQGKKFEYCYKKRGHYELTLLATSTVNQMRLIDTSYYQVDISNFAIINTQKNRDSQCYFNAQDSYIGKGYTITDYFWDFGDGTYDCSGKTPLSSHQYDSAGKYTLRLIVVGKNTQGEEKSIYSQQTITIAS